MTKLIKQETSLLNEEWYQQMLEDCKAILVERTFNACEEIIRRNWELGKRILEENEKMEREKIYGKKIIENIATDLGKSNSYVWQCVQFCKQYPQEDLDNVLNEFPEGKSLTWGKIVNKYLGGAKEEKTPKQKQSFKLTDVLEIFKSWIIKRGIIIGENELENAVNEFKEMIIKEKS